MTLVLIGKGLVLAGVDLKKIEVIWLPGIYIYIHTPTYQYNIPHWCFVFFFGQSSPFQLDLPKTQGDMEAEVGDITFVLAERGRLQFRQRGKPQPKRAQTP